MATAWHAGCRRPAPVRSGAWWRPARAAAYRATLVQLTDDGTDLNAVIRASRSTEADAFFGSLSDTDQAHLARILRKLRS